MRSRLALSAIALAGAIAISACCTTSKIKCKQFAATPAMAGIPAFPLKALQSPHAKRAKLYLDKNGRFTKYAVYVSKEGIPAWAHAAADKELGKGEDLEFEVEQYGTGEKVYEITRMVDGKKVELSLDSATKKKLYTEKKGLAVDALPAPVKAAVAKVEGFTAESYSLKEYASGKKLHEVEGKQGGKALEIYFDDKGAIIRKQRPMTAVLKVGH